MDKIDELVEKNIHKLNEMEKEYFMMMFSRLGVLYLKSEPGLAKTSIIKSIAKKMEMRFIDIRLASKDETDVGTYPHVEYIITDKDGSLKEVQPYTPGSTPTLNFIPPKWAVIANSQPTIVFFDELNRAPLTVRNAALQILLEKTIGEFIFSENVLMVAAGNLGDEDGTDVEDFDSALNNRLIHVRHFLPYKKWIEYFAEKNIHPLILDFIEAKPSFYYYGLKSGENGQMAETYATPRSWHMLSEFLFGMGGNKKEFLENGTVEYDIQEMKSILNKSAMHYVGASASMGIVKWIDTVVEISVDDIINNFPKVAKAAKKASRSRKTEILDTMKKMDMKEFTKDQTINVASFLELIDADQRAGFIIDAIIVPIKHEDIKKHHVGIIMDKYRDEVNGVLSGLKSKKSEDSL